MTKQLAGILLCLFFFMARQAVAHSALKPDFNSLNNSFKFKKDSVTHERDIIDEFHILFNNRNHPHIYKPSTKTGRFHFAAIPAAGYSLQTGFAGVLASNAVFYTDEKDSSKASSILASVAFTQYSQIILPLNADIWTKGEKYNIIVDYRYMNYPTQTFGLGLRTKLTDGYNIDYSYLKIHQAVLRNLTHNFFLGGGYYYDYLWNEREIDPPQNIQTGFEKYGLHSNETASGLCLQGLFDNRENQVNPMGGFYANLRLRANYKWMGSSTRWESGILDMRKYFRFPENSHNIIALWSYNWITFGGRPPYLLLPSTGWDDYFNTGRGYLQGRYRSKDMSYLEAEYRFQILRNGLLGGVVFGNLQTFSRDIYNQYANFIPGYGLGIRVKMNKHSSTNLCIDYGFGNEGSRGFFVNLGEVF